MTFFLQNRDLSEKSARTNPRKSYPTKVFPRDDLSGNFDPKYFQRMIKRLGNLTWKRILDAERTQKSFLDFQFSEIASPSNEAGQNTSKITASPRSCDSRY